jgi:ubiquinone/menaquinone biosynthesis C-methylase UbiE
MNQKQEFDAAGYKQTQRKQWNEDAAAWHRWGSTLEAWFGEVTRVMLDRAEIGPGSRVLDIATGAGEPALSAAVLVGSEGNVLATDLSENIIQFAQQLADERGLQNFETRAMDGENLELPDDTFDAVFCRFGLIYMPNVQQALSEWRRVLKPGGKTVVAVFSTPDQNQWGSVPVPIIRKRAQLPPPLPGQPGPFSLGGDGVLDDALYQAGFQNVITNTLSAPLRMKSAKECIRFERESFGAFNQMMSHLSKQEREAVWDEVEQAMQQFEGPNGFEVSCEPIVGVGVK